MYLYFSDWTTKASLTTLAGKGFPHSQRLIKVFASLINPQELFERPSLPKILPRNGPFAQDEKYDYPRRGVYGREELERYLESQGLDWFAKGHVRALFRFGHERLGCIQLAMAARDTDGYIFQHPFEPIDGLQEASEDPDNRRATIHLDIFSPSSLVRLLEVVDINSREALVTPREIVAKLGTRRRDVEGRPVRGKEFG